MPKKINEFLDQVYPSNGKLVTDKEGTIRTTIIDAETDGIACKFNNDNCVEIDTSSYSYLTLSRDNLVELINMIDKADHMYEKRTEKQWLKYEKVSSGV